MKKNKRAMTLLEIMIVIFIIGIIGSVIGYNMKGSLEEGKAFKTKEGIRQIYEILHLQMAKGSTMETVIGDVENELKNSGMVRNVKDLLKDGWGNDYRFSKNQGGGDIRVYSDRYITYCKKKKTEPYYPWSDE